MATNNALNNNLASGTGLPLTTGVTGVLPIANGGTGNSTYTAPTIQKFTSGSGTYTTPAGVKYITIEMVGGGGGGGGSTSSNNGGTGGTGGTTTFGTSLLTCTGGAGGTGTTQSAGGAGGTATLNSPAVGIAFDGARGSPAQESQGVLTNIYFMGGDGAQSPFGGAGPGYVNANGVGYSAATNTGSGGGGAGMGLGGIAGKGGGAGAYIRAVISSPSASYSYAVGAAGTAGAAGTSGSAGGAGAAGIIVVTEYYQ